MILSAIYQRGRCEVHPVAHDPRETFDAELQLFIALGIDGDECHLPRLAVRPDHDVGAGWPSKYSASLSLDGVCDLSGGLNRLHRLTHATGRVGYAIPVLSQCVSSAWLH